MPTRNAVHGRLAERGIQDGPPLYPSGWYTAAFADEISPGEVATRTFMGREIVLYRTMSGELHAAEAYCPHLGAHLGRGGKVRGETIECPFHTFRFSADGKCVFHAIRELGTSIDCTAGCAAGPGSLRYCARVSRPPGGPAVGGRSPVG